MRNIKQILVAPWFPYAAPFVTFILLTFCSSQWPEAAHFGYGIKTVIVGAMLIAYRRHYTELRWSASLTNWLIGIGVGLITLWIWVAPENLLAPLMFGKATGFNPHSFGLADSGVCGLIAIRLIGAAIVVPIMEELFWRSFLLRYLIDSDFKQVAIGSFRLASFVVVAIVFGVEHFRWIVGIAAGLIYGGLLIWRRDLFTCVLAHSITNLGLGIYVLKTERWIFW